jgi:hypothetical protein
MNAKQLKQKRDAQVAAMTEAELRNYVELMRTANNQILDAVVAFLNAGNEWKSEVIQNGEGSDATGRKVAKNLNKLIAATNQINISISEYWVIREALEK